MVIRRILDYNRNKYPPANVQRSLLMPAHKVVVHASYTTGIDAMMATQRNMRIYSPDGKLLNTFQRGINIVVYDDGTVHKILLK